MKRTKLLLFLLSFILICYYSFAQRTSEKVNAKDNYKADVVQKVESGEINWSQQYIEAKGTTIIDTVKFKNKAQAKLMAQRKATVFAQRKLLEIIQGVNVVGKTTARIFMVQNDNIITQVKGIVKGAQLVGVYIVKFDMIEVTIRIPIYSSNGLAHALKNSVRKQVQGPEYKVKTSEEATPIAFNLKDKNIDPALFIVAYDENDKVILDFSQFYDPKKGKFGKYFKTSEKLLDDLNLKKKDINVIDVVRNQDGKIVLDEKNKVKLEKWINAGKTITKIGKTLMMFI